MPVADAIIKAELYMRRATELKGLARTATGGGKATFKEFRGRYRRLAVPSSPLATATDHEIEMLAGRIVGRLLRESEREPDAAV
jgi:hypothetical protein